ncbi:MAG: hypothetical protein ACYDBB_03210 [Armatimonadota bacterium]
MQVTIRPSGEACHPVPATIFGHNMEMCIGVGPGLSTDRLANPKFMGPANADTGIAPGWTSAWNQNSLGMHYELTPGLSLSGSESQLMHNYSGREHGILQIGRKVRAGERLEVTLWVRGQYHPVSLRVGLRPLDAGKPVYDETKIAVTRTYWHEYRATLTVPQDDDAAVFFITLPEEGMVWIDQVHLRPEGAGTVRADLLDTFRTMQIPVLRFPGGCISTNYHWKHGTGPQQLRPNLPDPVFKFEMHYEFGTDEYLQLCLEQGIMPQISVNIGSGTPEEAGEWAAYVANWFRARNIEPPLMYWQMGNEHYGAWEIGSMSGEMYADALREFVPAVRANYPNARILALGHETGELTYSGQTAPWRAPILEKAADLVDVLALQCYCGGWDNDPQKRQAMVMQSAMGIAATVRKTVEDIQAAGVQMGVAVTEWNMWQYAAHHDGRDFLEKYDVQHGLFVATVLNDYTTLAPALELANFYNLLNVMGIILAHGPEVEETPLADIFRLYRPAVPGQATPLTVDSPMLDGAEVHTVTETYLTNDNGGGDGAEVPAVTATYLTNDNGGWLFLVNRSVTDDATVNLDAFPGAGSADLLIGTDLLGGFSKSTIAQEGQAITVPPMSIARVKVG